mgnify:CR=1 FL=1
MVVVGNGTWCFRTPRTNGITRTPTTHRYEAGVRNTSMWGMGPRTFELTWSENITIRNVTFRNSPSWTIHPTFSRKILAENIRIENPRFTPNTDGFDPDSCVDVILRDSYIDTGDDGISIKSMNSTQKGSEHIMMPSKNIHIYNTKILSRNVCIGSATFGGVYVVFVFRVRNERTLTQLSYYTSGTTS